MHEFKFYQNTMASISRMERERSDELFKEMNMDTRFGFAWCVRWKEDLMSRWMSKKVILTLTWSKWDQLLSFIVSFSFCCGWIHHWWWFLVWAETFPDMSHECFGLICSFDSSQKSSGVLSHLKNSRAEGFRVLRWTATREKHWNLPEHWQIKS